MGKCYNCPECGKSMQKKNGDYYCKKCDETFSADYVENRGDYDAD